MKLWITETEKVKRQAGEDAVIILQLWKQKVRRLRIYRACLCAALILAGMGLFGYSYYLVDSSIPSVIYMRAESEESLALDIPAKGEILSVSEQGTSNIPQGAVTLDLSQPVTMKTGMTDSLEMQVKLFGILPFKQVGIRVIEDQQLIPVGVPIGIYVKTEGGNGHRYRRVPFCQRGEGGSGGTYFEKRRLCGETERHGSGGQG